MDGTPEGVRIAPLAPREWPPEVREALASLRPTSTVQPTVPREGRPKGLNALGTLARHPSLARAFLTFNGHILSGSTLSPRHRELLVLRVAALRHCDYEWVQHAILAGDAGIVADEVERVAEGPDAPGWSDLDRNLLVAVDQLLADARIADDTWAALAGDFDEEQLMDVVFTVGAYDVLAMAFRSFGVELDDDLR